MDREHYVVDEIHLRSLNQSDYNCYHTINSDLTNFRANFLKGTGYNQGSPQGNRQYCETCGKSGPECIGHPMILDMNSLNRHFISEFALKHVTAISASICRACKQVVTSSDKKKYSLKELSKLPVTKKVCKCNSMPTIVEIKEEKGNEKKQKYQKKSTDPKKFTSSIEDLYNLIAGDDFEFPPEFGIDKKTVLGFFYNKLVMLPAAEHQINFISGTEASVSEYTGMMQLYEDIFQMVNKYGDAESPELKKKLVSMFIGDSDNNFTGTASYISKADGKEGIFRGDGLNKRAYNTGRAVITLATRRACEIQIPKNIQKNLQHEVKIMGYNVNSMQKKVGLTVTHLVSGMQTSTLNRRKIYTKLTPGYKLKLGDVVLKSLEDGDFVIFSRQPTLWRHSELGYVIFGWDESCIGLHECNTAGHNADFDGDEGNVSVGASLDERIENEAMLSRYNIMGAHSGEPVIGITYNGKVGSYVLSTDDNIEEKLFYRMVSIIEGNLFEDVQNKAGNYITDKKIDLDYYRRKSIDNNLNFFSGRILISMLLPRCLNYTRGDVVIKKGIMLSGRLKGVDVASKLISAISNISPWRDDYLFIDRGYAMFSDYITAKGITISSQDYIMPDELNKQIKAPDMEEQLEILKKKISELEKMKIGQTKAYASNIEEKIIMLISNFEKKCTEILETSEFSERHISIVSFKSGARGNVSNIMTANVMVGQQYDQAERLGSNGERLSLYLAPSEVSIYSRGFIEHSYSDGLNPSELCVIANPSRRATFTVYSGTPESGNAARQSSRNLGGNHIDGTLALVDGNGCIMDSYYGLDTSRSQNQEVNGSTINSSINLSQMIDMLLNINNR